MPLIYGHYIPLVVEDDVLVFARAYFGEIVIVGLNKSDREKTVEFALPAVYGRGTQRLTMNAHSHAIDFI
jgi:hypothetical protein